MEKESRYSIAAVSRALQVLKLFDMRHRSMSLTEISERMGVSKSSILRTLETLSEEDFLRRDPETKKYKLGMELINICNTGYEYCSVGDIAEPIMKAASERVHMVSHLAVLDGNDIIFARKTYPSNYEDSYIPASAVGSLLPVHCTGVGKVIAAFCDDEKREELLRGCTYERFTPATITDEETLCRELEKIRTTGFGYNREEHELYGTCITCPIFNINGKLVGAVSFTDLSQRINQKDQSELFYELKKTAEAIGNELF